MCESVFCSGADGRDLLVGRLHLCYATPGARTVLHCQPKRHTAIAPAEHGTIDAVAFKFCLFTAQLCGCAVNLLKLF
eukprot:SAG11_NODE_50_length_19992_cov_9.945157_11_plen_77_part_00